LGTGLDEVYPRDHRKLASEILERGGALVTQFPLGTPPVAENFPRRNRIISGLSLGVVVVEATEDSGSLITARLALEQGRDVFAVPGSIDAPLSRGPHGLIKEGAKLVETVDDIIEELLPQLNVDATPKRRSPSKAAALPTLSSDEQVVYAEMSREPLHLDDLAERCGLPVEGVSGVL